MRDGPEAGLMGSMTSRSLGLLAAVGLTVAATITGAAQSAPVGPTLLLPQGCEYVGTPVAYKVNGLSGDHDFHVSIGPRIVDSGTTDADGHADGHLLVPNLTRSERTVSVVATDGTNRATASMPVTAFDVRVSPPDGDTHRRVNVTLVGWATPGGRMQTVYLHYLAPGAQRARRTVKVARTGRTCGFARPKLAHLFPFVPPAGAWRLVFDARRRYRSGTRPRVVFKTTVGAAGAG